VLGEDTSPTPLLENCNTVPTFPKVLGSSAGNMMIYDSDYLQTGDEFVICGEMQPQVMPDLQNTQHPTINRGFIARTSVSGKFYWSYASSVVSNSAVNVMYTSCKRRNNNFIIGLAYLVEES